MRGPHSPPRPVPPPVYLGDDNMSKWKIWRRDKTPPQVKYCQCGGIKTRQSTLDEFFDLTPETQTRIIPPTTEQRIGMHGRRRTYRGSL